MNSERLIAAAAMRDLAVALRHNELTKKMEGKATKEVAEIRAEFFASHPIEMYFPTALQQLKNADEFIQANIS